VHETKPHSNSQYTLRRLTLLGLILGQLLGTLLVVFTCRDGECPLQKMRRVMEGDGDKATDPSSPSAWSSEFAELELGAWLEDVTSIDATTLVCTSAVASLPAGSPPALEQPDTSQLQRVSSRGSGLEHASARSARRVLMDAPKQSPPARI